MSDNTISMVNTILLAYGAFIFVWYENPQDVHAKVQRGFGLAIMLFVFYDRFK